MDSQLWIRIAVLWGGILVGLAAHPDSRQVLVQLWESARLLVKNGWIWDVMVMGWLAGEVYLLSLWLAAESIGRQHFAPHTSIEGFSLHWIFGVTGQFLVPYAAWAVVLFYFIWKRRIRSELCRGSPDMAESSRLIFGTIGAFLLFGGVCVCLNTFLYLLATGSLSFHVDRESLIASVPNMWWVRMFEGTVMIMAILTIMGSSYLTVGLVGSIRSALGGKPLSKASLFQVDPRSVARLTWFFIVVLLVSQAFDRLTPVLKRWVIGRSCSPYDYGFIVAVIWQWMKLIPVVILFAVPVLIVTRRARVGESVVIMLRLWRTRWFSLLTLLLLGFIPATIIFQGGNAWDFLIHGPERVHVIMAKEFLRMVAQATFAAVWLVATVRLVEQWRVEDEALRTRDVTGTGR
jgi:hypothetical protein